MTEMNRIEVGAATDVGHVRESNEDAHLAAPLNATGPDRSDWVIAVADGMGGHQAGEVASALAVRTLAEVVQRYRAGSISPAACLREAVQAANASIWRVASTDPGCAGMGTTLVCAVVGVDGRAAVANVGDSRAYLVGPTQARQVTQDHSWVADQVRAGRMSALEAEVSPYRNVLSRSLGVTDAVDVDIFDGFTLQPNQALVLCSDGVSVYFTPDEMLDFYRRSATAQEFAQRLVDVALARGGHDNATVVVARRISQPADVVD